MTTSSNGNIFCVTGPLCGEFTGHRWIPCTKASDTELWCFLSSVLKNERLSKQSGGWWLETPSRPLWRHCNESNKAIGSQIAKNIGSTEHRSHTFAADWCLINVDPGVFAFWVIDEIFVVFEFKQQESIWRLVAIRQIRKDLVWCPDVAKPKRASRWREKRDATLQVWQELFTIVMGDGSKIRQNWGGDT